MGYFERIIRSWVLKFFIGPNKFSAFFGYLARLKLPEFILTPFLKFYISTYKIDMNLFEDVKYRSFNKFFTRKLKNGLRSFKGELLSPSESVLSEFGLVNSQVVLDIKGMKCKLDQLCGQHELLNFKSFGLFYLSPADYHRVHAPFDMKITSIEYIEGDLYSVQPRNVEVIEDLFCQNKRVVLYGDCQYGKYALVMVGALIVGRIILSFSDIDFSNQKRHDNIEFAIQKGDEIGMFELGSTVILFLEDNALEKTTIPKGDHVLVGQDLLK